MLLSLHTKKKQQHLKFLTNLDEYHFRPSLSPSAQKPQNMTFLENLIPLLFKSDDNLTLCKKSENFSEQFWRKTPDKQTNR